MIQSALTRRIVGGDIPSVTDAIIPSGIVIGKEEVALKSLAESSSLRLMVPNISTSETTPVIETLRRPPTTPAAPPTSIVSSSLSDRSSENIVARTTLAAAAVSEDTCAVASTAQRLSLALVRYRRRDGADRPSAAPARARCGTPPVPDEPIPAALLPELEERDRLLRLRRRGGFRGRNAEGKADAGVEGAGPEAAGAEGRANERGDGMVCGATEGEPPAYLGSVATAAAAASMVLGLWPMSSQALSTFKREK